VLVHRLPHDARELAPVFHVSALEGADLGAPKFRKVAELEDHILTRPPGSGAWPLRPPIVIRGEQYDRETDALFASTFSMTVRPRLTCS